MAVSAAESRKPKIGGLGGSEGFAGSGGAEENRMDVESNAAERIFMRPWVER
jgi:hypothetical protein